MNCSRPGPEGRVLPALIDKQELNVDLGEPSLRTIF